MANNFQVTAGSGTTVATTESGAVHHPKQVLELDNSGTPVVVSNSNPVPVSDAGGSLTIDGSVTAVGSVAHDAAVSGNPVGIAGVASAAAPSDVSADQDAVRAWFLRNGAQAVNITAAGALVPGDATNGLDVDVTRMIPGTGATSLGKAEDAAHTSGDVGVMFLAVRNDAGTALAGTDGDYIPVSTDSSGAVRVTGGGGGTQYVEDAALGATPTGTLGMARRDDSLSTLTPVEDDAVSLRTNSRGALWIKPDGTVTVDNGGTFAVQAAIAAGATNIAKAEDAASADADVGVPAMAVRKATPANTSGTDGDYEMLQMSAGRVWASATIDAALPAGTNAIGNIGTVTTSVTPGTSAAHLGKAEDAAHASGDTGVMMLAVRRDVAASGTSADGDYATLNVDSSGNLRVTGGGGGTQYTEDSAHASGDTGTMALGVRRDTPTHGTSADGDYATMNVNSNGGQWSAVSDITTITVTPTISTSAYSINDNIGGKMSFANAVFASGGAGRITGINVVDQDNEKRLLRLNLFYTDPSGSTFTDNAQTDIVDADMSKILQVVPIADWYSYTDNAVCTVPVDIPFKLSTGTTLYGSLDILEVATFTATSDIIVTLVIERYV